jgi:A/G-specific adenine glycosylase
LASGGACPKQCLRAFLQLFGRNILLVGRDPPAMPKRILEFSAAIAIELVGDWPEDFEAGAHRASREGIDIFHIKVDHDGGSADRPRAQSVVLWKFVAQHNSGLANFEFRMSDLTLMRDTKGLDRPESVFVECDGFAGVAYGKVGYCSFMSRGYWLDWRAHLSFPVLSFAQLQVKRSEKRGAYMASPMSAGARAAGAVLMWYDRHRRDLPWRARPGETADPYKVWLSEIMLQQTTVAAVKPYFALFLARWPNIGVLAEASTEEVMRAWAGLGYYSRARNLHACAKIVAWKLSGSFPVTEAALRELPGVGAYTAAAIAAIAFGQRAAAIDGNVTRVVARLFSIETPLPAASSEIKARAKAMVPAARPGDFAQAMMDLGAMVCVPKQPSCGLCPVQNLCLGHSSGLAASLPRKTPRQERPLRRGAAFFVRRQDGAVLVRTRPAKGLLGGMTELPGTSWETDFDEALALAQAPLKAYFRKLESPIAHAFTHFSLRLSIYVAEVKEDKRAPDGYRWTPARELDREAFPGVMRKVIKAVRCSSDVVRAD